jgi:hypothetical protein
LEGRRAVAGFLRDVLDRLPADTGRVALDLRGDRLITLTITEIEQVSGWYDGGGPR